jgi:hypothetical protein
MTPAYLLSLEHNFLILSRLKSQNICSRHCIGEMSEIEEWRPSKYENYLVSSFGNVMRLNVNKRGESRVLKPFANNRGYLQVAVKHENQIKKLLVSRLVLSTFKPLEQEDERIYVDHINGCVTMNHISNLRWSSPSQNNYNRKKSDKSLCKGVTEVKKNPNNKYYATISFERKHLRKYFATFEEAANWRQQMEAEHHGEFARKN